MRRINKYFPLGTIYLCLTYTAFRIISCTVHSGTHRLYKISISRTLDISAHIDNLLKLHYRPYVISNCDILTLNTAIVLWLRNTGGWGPPGAPTPGAKRSGRDADHSCCMHGAIPPLLQHVFMASFLVEDRENLTEYRLTMVLLYSIHIELATCRPRLSPSIFDTRTILHL
jgi:hypothetical protein